MAKVVAITCVEPQSRADKARAILAFLNSKAGRNYKPTRVNLEFIENRLKEGYSMAECKQVIAKKVREWKGTDMDIYLRPATIFNATKFNQYAGELGVEDELS